MISIDKAEKGHVDDCIASLKNSILAEHYFTDEKRTSAFITEGIEKGEIYAAVNEKSECVGFIRIEADFAFSGFPLLRVIAVKQEFRSYGIGGILLDFFEEKGYATGKKVFLFVSELNKRAQKLYERKGYVRVGSIPGFYAEGINEILMMKAKT